MRPTALKQVLAPSLASGSSLTPRHVLTPILLKSLPPAVSPRHRNLRQSTRYASHLPSSSRAPPAPLKMPLDMPREDYAAPAMYTLSYMSRIIRFLIYGVVSLGAAGLMTYEGMHLWIEHVALGAPAGSVASIHREEGGSDSSYGWQEENTSWTGGAKGGTDPRLGFKARHALRAAWICKEIGAGGPGSIGSARSSGAGHGARAELGGMIGNAAMRVNRVDRGYELAEEYIDVAISAARRKGMVFPPNLSGARSGPEYLASQSGGSVPVDSTAVDLLLLKAGILERISTHDSLLHAKDLYEQVLASTVAASANIGGSSEASKVRLAGKIGDLESMTGGDGMRWWEWGMQRAGLDSISVPKLEERIEGVEVKQAKQQSRGWGWFGAGSKVSETTPHAIAEPPTTTVATSLPDLSPALLRATLSTLIHAEAHLAQTGQLAQASHLQDLALSLILPRTASSSTSTTPAATLHNLWLSHRSALISLHKTSVAHAQRQPALDLATSSTDSAEAIIPYLPPIPARSNILHQATKLLHRDALLLAAEANYTKALLLEKKGGEAVDHLEMALEGFERAMALSGMEGGGEEGVKGEEWARYWKGYARVKERIDRLVEK